ncbi:hypothetical protein HOJ01_00360 [bacterium]|jgi:hypothetical protein|nr:hypothetical protein [bacterium]MBT6293240.1 hypothetical protein [bacterium]
MSPSNSIALKVCENLKNANYGSSVCSKSSRRLLLRTVCEQSQHNFGFVEGFEEGANCVDKAAQVDEILANFGFNIKVVKSLKTDHRMNVIYKEGRTYIYDASIFQEDLIDVSDLQQGQEIVVDCGFSNDSKLIVSRIGNQVSVDLDLGNGRSSDLQNNTYNLEDVEGDYPSASELITGRKKPPVFYYRYFDYYENKQRSVIMITSNFNFLFGVALEGGFQEEDPEIRNTFEKLNGFSLAKLKESMKRAVSFFSS